MLRGITSCNIEGFTMGFTPVFGGFVLLGLATIVTLKVVLMVQQILRHSKTPILPLQHQDTAVGTTTAIMRSPSDPVL